jgi:hypothetical protein
MPSVTFVLTTYNDSHFLKTAIPSCVSQDVDKEIILVDDASTAPMDPSVGLLVGQFGIRLVRHDVNKGLSAARNTGIEAASSDWVIPLDADDWFYPDAVKALWENRDGCDVVCGYCTDSGSVYKPGIFHAPLTKELFIENNPIICSSLFTKDIWRKVGGYMVRQGPHYEDWSFWAKCFAAGARFKPIDVQVYNHTSRPDSMLRILHPNRDFYRKLAVEGVFDK